MQLTGKLFFCLLLSPEAHTPLTEKGFSVAC